MKREPRPERKKRIHHLKTTTSTTAPRSVQVNNTHSLVQKWTDKSDNRQFKLFTFSSLLLFVSIRCVVLYRVCVCTRALEHMCYVCQAVSSHRTELIGDLSNCIYYIVYISHFSPTHTDMIMILIIIKNCLLFSFSSRRRWFHAS